jgi:hypothetical protein
LSSPKTTTFPAFRATAIEMLTGHALLKSEDLSSAMSIALDSIENDWGDEPVTSSCTLKMGVWCEHRAVWIKAERTLKASSNPNQALGFSPDIADVYPEQCNHPGCLYHHGIQLYVSKVLEHGSQFCIPVTFFSTSQGIVALAVLLTVSKTPDPSARFYNGAFARLDTYSSEIIIVPENQIRGGMTIARDVQRDDSVWVCLVRCLHSL